MIGLGWVDREPPLAVGGCVGRGDAARRLAARLLAAPDAELARLEGVGGPGVLAVFGPAEALPWVDGLEWLGRDPLAPALWLPTRRRPAVPLELVQAAVLRRLDGAGPTVLLEDALVPAAGLPVDRRHLESWVSAHPR